MLCTYTVTVRNVMLPTAAIVPVGGGAVIPLLQLDVVGRRSHDAKGRVGPRSVFFAVAGSI